MWTKKERESYQVIQDNLFSLRRALRGDSQGKSGAENATVIIPIFNYTEENGVSRVH